MWAPFILLGDKTDHGGTVTSASITTDVEGRGIARVGDTVICPKCGRITRIITGDPTNLIDGLPAAIHGSKTDCGATLIASQATTGISTGEPKQAATNLNDIAATLVTRCSVSKAVISTAEVAFSTFSADKSSSSPTASPYPRVEEAEEEEEIGEVEMREKRPLDDDLEYYVQLYQEEINKLQAVLGAGNQAETADLILSILHMPSPKNVLKVISKAVSNRIDDALRRGVGTLRSEGKEAVKEDLDRSREHIREAIKWYEEQISLVHQRQARRRSRQENVDEFTLAREREELEKYLNETFESYHSKIIDEFAFSREAARQSKVFYKELNDKTENYRKLYLAKNAPYDEGKYKALEGDEKEAYEAWRDAEGRYKGAMSALDAAGKEEYGFKNGDLGEKISSVETMRKIYIKQMSLSSEPETPFDSKNSSRD